MINELLQAISTAISDEFGQEYTVYTDMPEQEQAKPCFLIEHLTFSVVPYLGSRRTNVCAFDIQYFSKAGTQQDMCEVLIRLCDCLRMITSAQDNRFLGSDFHTKRENGVLHCLINYNFVTQDAAADEHAMSDVKIEQGLENTDGSSENQKRNRQ